METTHIAGIVIVQASAFSDKVSRIQFCETCGEVIYHSDRQVKDKPFTPGAMVEVTKEEGCPTFTRQLSSMAEMEIGRNHCEPKENKTSVVGEIESDVVSDPEFIEHMDKVKQVKWSDDD